MLRVCLCLGSALLLLATASNAQSNASSSSSSSTDSSELNGWYSCSEFTFADEGSSASDAECAVYSAPLCYTGVCVDAKARTLDVFVKRIPATANADKMPNVWFLQGGPGAGSTAMESAMVDVYAQFNGNVNVYTMDHRGTGRSTRLDCVAAQATMSGSPFGSDISVGEVPNCAKDLEIKYGKDLSAFSITSAATDVSTFITKFQGSTGATYVYGVSYGTSVVERLIHLKNPAVSGYILDGISTTSGSDVKNFEYFSNWDNDYGEVGDHFMTFCATDASCAARFPSVTLSATLKNIIATFDTQPDSKCAALVRDITSGVPGTAIEPASYTLRKSLGSLFQADATRAVIPALAYRLNRCSDVDVPVLRHYFNSSSSELSTASEEDVFQSTLLYYLIVFSEMWETPVPSLATMTARFTSTSICNGGTISNVPTYCMFSKEKSATCTSVNATTYAASPLLYKKDKYWNTAAEVPAGASVLLLSSKMDPQTPHKYAEWLLAAINSDNKELVTFEHASHGTLWTTPYSNDAGAVTCGMALLVSYVKNGGDLSKLDKSCVAAMPPLSFAIDDSTVHSLLATKDAYDGKFDASLSPSTGSSSSGTSYKTVFIIFLVLFVVAAIACFIFVLRWRKAKRESANKAASVQSNPSTHNASNDVSPSGTFAAPREQM